MADPVIMCANERWKSVSRTLFQLGSLLFAAAIVKIYGSFTLTLETGCWLIAALGITYVGWKVLILLESES